MTGVKADKAVFMMTRRSTLPQMEQELKGHHMIKVIVCLCYKVNNTMLLRNSLINNA